MTLLHGIASRDDLPLPFELIVAGSAVVVIVTFLVLAQGNRDEERQRREPTPVSRLSRVVDSPVTGGILRGLGLLVWGAAAAALLFGVDRIDNPVFGFVYVLVWVGLVPAALLFGRVYQRTSPARLLHPHDSAPSGDMSVAPAAVALLFFLYTELVEPTSLQLTTMRIYAALWLGWLLVGVALRGRRWVAQEPFDAYAAMIAQSSPWTRTRDGVLAVVSPVENLARWQAPRHLALLASVLLAGTLFDAASASSWWVRSTQSLPVDPRVPGILGLLLSVGLVLGLFTLAARPLRSGESTRRAADALAPGLVPLVAAYVLSHYLTMLYLEGQRTIIRFSDPLGQGWDVLGLALASPDTTLLAFPWALAVVQVLLIVAGHVVGTLVTHRIAADRVERGRLVRAQVPMLVLMVAITVSGMLLMFGE